jgi:hypothetical protein
MEQAEKLERLQDVGKQIGGVLAGDWDQDAAHTSNTLRDLATFACMPSMVKTVEGHPQSKTNAKQVTRNFRALYNLLLSTDLVDGEAVAEHENGQLIFGAMTEIAVLGTLWWGITNNQRSADVSILPTTTAQDMGTEQDGYRTGTDIFIRSGPDITHRIQVKGSLEDSEKIASYYRDITVLTPNMLTHRCGGFPAVVLVHALIDNDYNLLRQANLRAEHQIIHKPFQSKNPQLSFYIPPSHPRAPEKPQEEAVSNTPSNLLPVLFDPKPKLGFTLAQEAA